MALHDRLTPRAIALGHLVNLFATHRELPLGSRQELAFILIEQVSGSGGADSVIEQGLHQLRAALVAMPPAFLETFDGLLLSTTTPDDLWTLMGALQGLVSPDLTRDPPLDGDSECGCPMQLERSSVLGLFARRTQIAFHRATFEELCTLVTHFGAWAAPGAESPAPGSTPPIWRRVLPRTQLENYVHGLARSLEEGLGEVPPEKVQADLRDVLLYAPSLPQAHYLQLQLLMQQRCFEPALEAFHRYFDSIASGASTADRPAGAPSPSPSAAPSPSPSPAHQPPRPSPSPAPSPQPQPQPQPQP